MKYVPYVHLYKCKFFVKYISKLFIIVFAGQINWHMWHYTTFWWCTYGTLVKYNINSLKIPRYHLRNKMIDVILLFSFLYTYVSVYKFVEITKVPLTYVIFVRRDFISYCLFLPLSSVHLSWHTDRHTDTRGTIAFI